MEWVTGCWSVMTTTFEVESGDMTVNENVGGVRNGALAAARAGESKQYIQALFEEDARRLVTVERMESRGVMENVVNDPGRREVCVCCQNGVCRLETRHTMVGRQGRRICREGTLSAGKEF